MILQGDVIEQLERIKDKSVHCCVTSPPYWGLRDYGTTSWEGGDSDCDHVIPKGESDNKNSNDTSHNIRFIIESCYKCGAKRIDQQIGLESSIDEYIDKITEVFTEVFRVLRDDGTLWLNIGDSYNGSGGAGGDYNKGGLKEGQSKYKGRNVPELKPKDLCGIPWRVAFALQKAGWYLRQDIIWHKPNPMPESVKDRCAKSHEYIFLMTKSANPKLWKHRDSGEWVYKKPKPDYRWKNNTQIELKFLPYPIVYGIPYINQIDLWKYKRTNLWQTFDYYFDMNAIKEPQSDNTHSRYSKRVEAGLESPPEAKDDSKETVGGSGYRGRRKYTPKTFIGERNRRSVWTIATKPFKGAHFATFPTDLIEPCILAGCPVGGIVLDPFIGSGTVGVVALQNNRKYVGIELNPEYVKMAKKRIKLEAGT